MKKRRTAIGRLGSGAMLLMSVACSPSGPTPSPADPPGAIADAYDPFSSSYQAQVLGAAKRLRAQIGGECLMTRILRLDDGAAVNVPGHYARALSGWRGVQGIGVPGGWATAYRRGDDRFALGVLRPAADGRRALVIVTNTFWDAQSRRTVQACRTR